MSATVHLRTWDQVLATLDALAEGAPPAAGWTLPQALIHCAQSIEFSLIGYPSLRSGLFRATIGPLAKRRFLGKGAMSHDCGAAIPGAPDIAAATTLTASLTRLRSAISAFRKHDGPLAPHLAYGPCTAAEYEALHAMHIADHLRAHAAT